MPDIALLHRTGDPVIDRVLLGLVGLTELLAPGRVAAYYLGGSHAAGTAVPTSDLDLLVVLRAATPKHLDGLRATYERCGQLSAVAIDPTVLTEAEVRELGAGWVVEDRRLLYGTDVLATPLPAAPPAVEVRRWMRAAGSVLYGVYGRAGGLALPLAAPDPADPWLGFADLPVRLPGGREEPGLRRLEVTCYWAANALLMRRTGARVVRKGPGVADRFRDVLGAEWYPFLRDVFTRCKGEWHHRIPTSPEARRDLRARCERAVAFHTFFLADFRDYVVRELRGSDPDARRAAAELAALFAPDHRPI